MIHYLDTSFLVAALTAEAATEPAKAWLRSRDAGALAISHWSLTEFTSALSIKVRTGKMQSNEQSLVRVEWARFQDALHVLSIEPRHFQSAADIAGRHELGLRSGDALHIAIAQAAGLALVTLDRRMAEAARELGVAVVDAIG